MLKLGSSARIIDKKRPVLDYKPIFPGPLRNFKGSFLAARPSVAEALLN